PNGIPARPVPTGRPGPHRCAAPRPPGLCRVHRLPAAQPATAPGASAARRVRGVRRARDGDADSFPVNDPGGRAPTISETHRLEANAVNAISEAVPVAATAGSKLQALNAWVAEVAALTRPEDRKSTRLNSSHVKISYAV